MKKIIIPNVERSNVIELADVTVGCPIFAKQEGTLIGMLVNEDKGWILRIGSGAGVYGHDDSLEKTIRTGESYGFEFYIER